MGVKWRFLGHQHRNKPRKSDAGMSGRTVGTWGGTQLSGSSGCALVGVMPLLDPLTRGDLTLFPAPGAENFPFLNLKGKIFLEDPPNL